MRACVSILQVYMSVRANRAHPHDAAPPMTDNLQQRAFIALHLTLGIVIAVEGALVLAQARSADTEQIVVAFACLETLAALLFLFPRSKRVGGICLVAASVIAAVFEIAHGEFPADHLVYAAAAGYVTLRGNAWTTWTS